MKEEPAFPVVRMEKREFAFQAGGALVEVSYPGLTKGEYFAAKAMQGLLASPIGRVESVDGKKPDNERDLADIAVRMADALIAALEKK